MTQDLSDLKLEELVGRCWQHLCDKDDRTSPEEYPDMCLITCDELAEYMTEALLSALKEAREALRPFHEAVRDADDDSFADRSAAWESPMSMCVTYADFRRASHAFTTLGGSEHER